MRVKHLIKILQTFDPETIVNGDLNPMWADCLPTYYDGPATGIELPKNCKYETLYDLELALNMKEISDKEYEKIIKKTKFKYYSEERAGKVWLGQMNLTDWLEWYDPKGKQIDVSQDRDYSRIDWALEEIFKKCSFEANHFGPTKVTFIKRENPELYKYHKKFFDKLIKKGEYIFIEDTQWFKDIQAEREKRNAS